MSGFESFQQTQQKKALDQTVKHFKLYLLTFVLVTFLLNAHFLFFFSIHMNKSNINNQTQYDLNLVINVSDYESFKNLSLKVTDQDLAYFECSGSNENYVYFLEKIWIWFETIVYLFGPLIIIITCILFIYVRINKFNQKYAALLNDVNYKTNAKIYLKRIRQNNLIVYKLVAIEAYFLLSSTSIVCYAALIRVESGYKVLLVKSLVDIVFFSNNSLNIAFYGLVSEKYRNELVKIFKKFKHVTKDNFL
jgi:hypothetical protein